MPSDEAAPSAVDPPWAPETPVRVQRALAAVQEAIDAIRDLGEKPADPVSADLDAILSRDDKQPDIVAALVRFRFALWSAHHPIGMAGTLDEEAQSRA